LDQGRKATRRPDIVKDRYYRDRVGGGDDRAEDDTRKHSNRRDRPQGEADDEGANDDADNGEEENGRHLVAELANIDADRGFEQKRRQKDVEERFSAKPKVAQPTHHIADDPSRLIGQGNIGRGADRDPHQGEQHGIGNGEPLRERQQQADQPEKGCDGKNGLNGVMHG
jgi:hypothetical protein